MLAYSVQADLKDVDRELRDAGIEIRRAGYTALKRVGGIIRRRYIAALRKNGTDVTGKFPAYAKAWYRLLGHGSRKPGGSLVTNSFWPITGNRVDTITVDIAPRLREHLERWQFGGGDRPAQLRKVVAWYRDTEKGRKVYHGKLVKLGYPPHISQLPPVVDQPVRDVVGPIREDAESHVVDWFIGALRSIARGRATLFQPSGSHVSHVRSSASRRAPAHRDYASVKGRR